MPYRYRSTRRNPPVVSNGTTYDLMHLQPLRMQIPRSANDDHLLNVEIRFGSHVFTERNTETGKEVLIDDGTGALRRFSPDRYGLSLNLPDLCRQAMGDLFPVWESLDTGRKKSFAMTGPWLREQKEVLHVFFRLRPGHAQSEIDVIMEVVSAYKRLARSRRMKRKTIIQILRQCYFQRKRLP